MWPGRGVARYRYYLVTSCLPKHIISPLYRPHQDQSEYLGAVVSAAGSHWYQLPLCIVALIFVCKHSSFQIEGYNMLQLMLLLSTVSP